MNNCTPEFHETGKISQGDDNLQHWIAGVCLTLLLITLFVIAGVCMRQEPRGVDGECLQRVTNGEHASLEAFFQNPVQRDAMAQAINACSGRGAAAM
ncbi:hypothetical protein [Paraburkholderia fungorum]